jgi:hypothetical protein
MSEAVVVFHEPGDGSEGDRITIERVTYLPEEPRGLAELKRLSEASREPEFQSYTTT